jgi:hypothetical protein
MRKILIASLVVAGIGFVGTSATSAAPVNGITLKLVAASMNDSTTQVGWHGRWRSHWRWGSRGGGGGGGRCHVRWRSWWHWC